MNNNSSTKYGYDFAALIGKVYVILRSHTGEYYRATSSINTIQKEEV